MMHESRSLLLEMVGNRICPDDFTSWILVEGYAKEGRLLSALNVIVELQRFGVSVCRDIFDYLIVALCKENRPYAAKELLERMSQSDLDVENGKYLSPDAGGTVRNLYTLH
ncbi:hypothetical protein C3L33_21196, partial [Rhododendron williamsianum]